MKDYNRLSFDALERHEVWRAEQSRVFKEVKLASQIVAEVTDRDEVEQGGEGEQGGGEVQDVQATDIPSPDIGDTPSKTRLETAAESFGEDNGEVTVGSL
jgi:hypothetical protein